jgi:hypothetical protein
MNPVDWRIGAIVRKINLSLVFLILKSRIKAKPDIPLMNLRKEI